jgi:hypothetical protein
VGVLINVLFIFLEIEVVCFVDRKTGKSIVDLGKMNWHQLSEQHTLERLVMSWLSRLPLSSISSCSRPVAGMDWYYLRWKLFVDGNLNRLYRVSVLEEREELVLRMRVELWICGCQLQCLTQLLRRPDLLQESVSFRASFSSEFL